MSTVHLKSPYMTLPRGMASFLSSSSNKKKLLNLVEISFVQEKEKLGTKENRLSLRKISFFAKIVDGS